MSQLTQEYVDTEPVPMNVAEAERQAKVMARFAEREAEARSTGRFIVALMVISCFLAWFGWI